MVLQLFGFFLYFWIKLIFDLCCRYFRVQGLLIKKMHLEEAMAWMSTLGGAFSSLGDYFESHVSIIRDYLVG